MIRKNLSMLAVAATALAAVALVSGTASASSGGGCGIATDGGVTACDSASGSNVNYDIYIPSVPSGCEDITLSIYDDDTGRGDTLHIGCRTGHYGQFSVAGLNGHRYHSSAIVWYSGWTSNPSIGHELVFSD